MSVTNIIRFPQAMRFDTHTHLMGIVDIDPAAEGDPVQHSIALARQMIDQGVDLLDIGVVGSKLSSKEELGLVIPVIKAIKKTSSIPLSIKTSDPKVADLALEAGATILNDCEGLGDGPEMVNVAVKYSVPLVIVHNEFSPLDTSSSWQSNMRPRSLGERVSQDLENTAIYAISHGLNRRQVILDPGIGLGKQANENLELLNNLECIRSLGYPILLNVSRHMLIGFITDAPTDERLPGSLSAATIGVMKGANILRVHDVSETRQATQVIDAVRKA